MHDVQNVPCTARCAEQSIYDVGTEMVRLRTHMDSPDRLRQNTPTDRWHSQRQKNRR
jgi:hypothetical protein